MLTVKIKARHNPVMVTYTTSWFNITQAYIQNEGVRSFNYGESRESVPITGGDDTRLLEVRYFLQEPCNAAFTVPK